VLIGANLFPLFSFFSLFFVCTALTDAKKAGEAADSLSPSMPPAAMFAQTQGNGSAPSATGNAPPRKREGHNRRLSNWVASQDSSGDPLWGNLLYCLPLDNVIMIYSPKNKEKISRLFGTEQGILTQTVCDVM
jgi:hypothetical protein